MERHHTPLHYTTKHLPSSTAHTKTQSDSPLCTRTYTAYAVPDNVSNPLNPIFRCPNPRGLFADFAAYNGITCRGRSSGSSPLFQTFPLQCNSGCKKLKLSYMRLTAAGQRLNCTAFPIKCDCRQDNTHTTKSGAKVQQKIDICKKNRP